MGCGCRRSGQSSLRRVEGSSALASQPGEPRLRHSFVVPPEMEPYLFCELAIDIAIADVNIPVRLKTGFDVRQHVLRHPEIDGNAVTIPYLLLPRGETVGATANDEAQLFGSADHFNRDPTGRVAEFHGAVDIKADKES